VQQEPLPQAGRAASGGYGLPAEELVLGVQLRRKPRSSAGQARAIQKRNERFSVLLTDPPG